MNIKLEGIEQHPRYNNDDSPIFKFNLYLQNAFYRYMVMVAIQGLSDYREPINIVNDSYDEAALIEDEPNQEEYLDFENLLISFLSSKQYRDQYRGDLFEQAIRYQGPESPVYEYRPECNSLEVVRVFCETSYYRNGESLKNLDVAFFNGTRSDRGRYITNEFIGCEIKCNINSFIRSILESIKRGNNLEDNKPYQKLLYLKEMALHFKKMCVVLICTLNNPNTLVQAFLEEYGLSCIQQYNPIL